jgi:aminoglycoside 2''-phosphotransferase
MDISTRNLAHIEARFPNIDLARVRHDPDGLVNDVFIVDERWVFRFAKNAQGRTDLARERLILDLIRPHLIVAVPDFEPLDEDGVVYPMIQGAPLYRHHLLRLDSAVQDAIATQLGEFLHVLHAISDVELASHGLGELLPGFTQAEWLDRFDQAEQALSAYLWADQRAWMADLFAPARAGQLDMTFAPVLIHNDLASYHILVQPGASQPRITGVIDFGIAGPGDPAADFATLISTYGASFVQRMAASYPGLHALLDRARVRAGYLELEWVLKGLKSGDPGWYMVHIGRARDTQPITQAALPRAKS